MFVLQMGYERDSRIFTNAEIIFDDFGSKDTLLLNNRGQTFVSLSGFLEILSKTELSSDKIDDFYEPGSGIDMHYARVV